MVGKVSVMSNTNTGQIIPTQRADNGENHTLVIHIGALHQSPRENPSAENENSPALEKVNQFKSLPNLNIIHCSCNSPHHDSMTSVNVTPHHKHHHHLSSLMKNEDKNIVSNGTNESLITNNNYSSYSADLKNTGTSKIQTITRKRETSTEVLRVSTSSSAARHSSRLSLSPTSPPPLPSPSEFMNSLLYHQQQQKQKCNDDDVVVSSLSWERPPTPKQDYSPTVEENDYVEETMEVAQAEWRRDKKVKGKELAETVSNKVKRGDAGRGDGTGGKEVSKMSGKYVVESRSSGEKDNAERGVMVIKDVRNKHDVERGNSRERTRVETDVSSKHEVERGNSRESSQVERDVSSEVEREMSSVERGVSRPSEDVGTKVDDRRRVENGSSPILQIAEPDRYGFFGGDQYTNDSEDDMLPLDIIRRRELKWLTMLDNWDKFMQKHYDKVRERCRKGIPSSIRSRAWQHLCGGFVLRGNYPHQYEELSSSSHADPNVLDVIEKDLHRLFPHHELFSKREGVGQTELYKVLKAHSLYNPKDGYCQAQGPVAAVLLMHMPGEDTFWALASICDRYLPGYYSEGLEALQLDGDVLVGLVKKHHPHIYKHLKSHNIDPILYMTEWFMCIFSRTLPWASVLRVWDMFFCEGVKVLFRVALVLLHSVLGSKEVRKKCESMYDTLNLLKKIPKEYMVPSYLIPQVLKVKVTAEELEVIHKQCLKKRRIASQGKR